MFGKARLHVLKVTVRGEFAPVSNTLDLSTMLHRANAARTELLQARYCHHGFAGVNNREAIGSCTGGKGEDRVGEESEEFGFH